MAFDTSLCSWTDAFRSFVSTVGDLILNCVKLPPDLAEQPMTDRKTILHQIKITCWKTLCIYIWSKAALEQRESTWGN